MKISFSINGEKITREIRPSLLLIDLIRDELGLKGTKPGCLEGECGACTVLVDGKGINSCMYLAVNAHEKEVITIEGLSQNGDPEPVQEAMIRAGGIQCGFCTPGMIMAIKALQNSAGEKEIPLDRDHISKQLEGNLCRCTGYVKILNAAEKVLMEGDLNREKSK